jgi:hypothetical protein
MNKISELIDRIESVQKKRDRVVSMLDEQITALRSELEGAMKAAGIVEAVGRSGARASWRKIQSVKVNDWVKFYQWMFQAKAWDVLQRRVTPNAVLARIKAGERVPEVIVETKDVLVVEKGGQK